MISVLLWILLLQIWDIFLLGDLCFDIISSYSDLPVLTCFKYKSIDGDLGGIVGDSWFLKTDLISSYNMAFYKWCDEKIP
jgi:hypothetical protein